MMTKRLLLTLFGLGTITSAVVLALSVPPTRQEQFEANRDRDQDDRGGRENRRDDDNDHRDRRRGIQLPNDQFVTPTAIEDSVQHYLNPRLPAYPDFIAGEAVRSQLSPDGTTLAILTAGQNSLYRPDGTVDPANSTQYIFLYDVTLKDRPSLKQVIKQMNSHVGLVFSPDGDTLYAAGGNDDAVYVYMKSGTGFTPAPAIALSHYPPGSTGSARNRGIGLSVQPNASGMDISADGQTLVVANNYNDSISVIDTATRTVRYEHDLRPYFASNEGRDGGVGGTFPFAVVLKGGSTAYVSSDRDRQVVVIDVSSATADRLIRRIRLDGNALGMTLDKSQSKLYVAQDNADQVAVIDTSMDRVVARDASPPRKR
jgi:DNA-binding beta-propeller fold protein YncE